MEHDVIHPTWNHAKCSAPYNVFLKSNTCSPSLLGQRVPLDSANGDQSAGGYAARQHTVIASTGSVHTYYGQGFNFYIEHSRGQKRLGGDIHR